MCPEHADIKDIEPKSLRAAVREELTRLEWETSLIETVGFAFIVSGEHPNWIIKLEELAELTDSQRSDAKKKTSSRHVVLKMHGRSRHDEQAAHHNKGGHRQMPRHFPR